VAVAQRRQEEDAHGIAQLRERGHESHLACTRADVGLQLAQHRLAV